MVHHNVCPLCSSDKIGLQFSCTDYLVSKTDFRIFRCSSCGFSFTQDYPEERDIGRFYESDSYISHSDTSEGLSNKLYLLARNLMIRRKKKLIQNLTGLRKGNILDIGSGTGYFASSMKRDGWVAKGIEINERASKFAVTHFGLDIFAPDKLPEIEAGSYDCVTLWHVLEHFHEPYKYASEIFRVLKHGAVCVIAVPNSRSYDAEYYNRFWAAWDVPRHLWHFNPDTFKLFSEKTGFSLEKLKRLPLDVFYISMLSEKYKGSGLSFIRGMVMAGWFAFLSLFNKKKSSSIIYILRKL